MYAVIARDFEGTRRSILIGVTSGYKKALRMREAYYTDAQPKANAEIISINPSDMFIPWERFDFSDALRVRGVTLRTSAERKKARKKR